MWLLLDTAVLIYAVESPAKLNKRVASSLADIENILELSSISLVEIATKTAIGKLKMPEDVTREAIETLGIRVLPFTADTRSSFLLFPSIMTILLTGRLLRRR